jgi:hypothetical protein
MLNIFRFTTAVSLAFLATAPSTFAQSFDEESQFGYDYIVRELSRGETSLRTPAYRDPFSEVKIHLGVAFLSSHINVDPSDRKSFSGFHRGFEANFGIDLFTPLWIAEGVVRSFSPQKLGQDTVALKEFELRLIRRYAIASGLTWRLGGGLSARYLDVTSAATAGTGPESGGAIATTAASDGSSLGRTSSRFTTPASVITTGIEMRFTDILGLGLEVSYRSALIDETADRQSVDAGFRIAGRF